MALLSGGDQSVQVLVTSKGDTKGIDETTKSLTRLDREAAHASGGGLSKLSHIASGAISVIKTMSIALGAAGVAAGGFALKSASNFEQTRIGLENMLGSADKARKLLGDISKFAAETPFEFPELAQATRQLVAFGFSGDAAFATMKQLGDVSAAVGAPINDLAYLMGTLKTQGRAFTIDLRQFAQRGIPIYEYLAKVLGTNEQALSGMVEEGKIGFPEVQKAFEMMTAQGGKFHNTMSKQSKSLAGLFSTLKDNIGMTARELIGITATGDIIEGSLFAKIQEGTTGLIRDLPTMIQTFKEWLKVIGDIAIKVGDYLAPKLIAVFNTLKEDLFPAISSLIQAIGPEVGAGLVGALGLAIDALNVLLKVLSPVIDWLSKNEWAVYALVTAFGVWYAMMKSTAAFNVIYNSLALLNANMAGSIVQIGSMRAALGALNASLVGFAGFGILAGAAVAAFAIVNDQINKTMKTWDEADSKLAKRDINEYVKTYNNIKQKRGEAAAHEYARQQSRAKGGQVSAGQIYAVGDNPDGTFNDTTELFVPNQSGHIMNAQKTKQLTGGTDMGGSGTTYNIAKVELSTAQAVREFFKIDADNNNRVQNGIAPRTA